MDNGQITIQGAAQHNLKHISLSLPRQRLIVVTGPSGSGKSSLAFDTLYAEGQRRYVESLSAYARQFLDRMQKPQVEHIEGLSPAIAIEQRTGSSSPRSIVATTTEIYDYLRLLYTHVGHPHCPKCGKPISNQSPETICRHLEELPAGRKLLLMAPYARGKKGEQAETIEQLRRDGFVRARIDGKLVSLDDDIKLAKTLRHTIEAVVDRLVTGQCDHARLNDSVEVALKRGNGVMTFSVEDETAAGGWRDEVVSEALACPDCGLSFGELLPRNFSFNSPFGACPACDGLGKRLIFKPEDIIPDPSKSIREGAVPLWRRGPRNVIMLFNHYLRCLAAQYDFSLTTPWEKLPTRIQKILLYGTGDEIVVFDYRMRGRMHEWRKPFEGIIPNLIRRLRETDNDELRARLEAAASYTECDQCHGSRLKPEYLAVTIGGLNIRQFCDLSIDEALDFLQKLELTETEKRIGGDVLHEIKTRLGFLKSVGLNYLTLNRESGTLSGGEGQRIRLASQIGSGLVGVLYILDEPSIGLHQRDNNRLINSLKQLRDAGNTVVVVEHDLDTMRAADYLVDLGPGAGEHGGHLVAAGTPAEVAANRASVTGDFLAGRRTIAVPAHRNPGDGHFIRIRGAAANNLKSIDVEIPLGLLCCVTGVSGSGKSSLVNHILRRSLSKRFGVQDEEPGPCKGIDGLEHIDKMIVIDQAPIGKTPRSNPATYTGLFDLIRSLYALTNDAKVRGYGPGRFSFNVKGGRCEKCKGDGIRKIEMQFLPDIYVPCEECHGLRYNSETLNVRFKGRSIADVLDMTVDEACDFFADLPRLHNKLKTLKAVGLGYIHLGQPATTLSGGEAQRVKLATELSRKPHGHTLYILDEPTTGLHLADIEQLLKVLFELRDLGNTVLVIEHNLDVIKTADWILDLGPEGGADGGRLIAQGTPEQVARNKRSFTGQFLKPLL